MGSLIRTEREKGDKVSIKSFDMSTKKTVYNSGINISNVKVHLAKQKSMLETRVLLCQD